MKRRCLAWLLSAAMICSLALPVTAQEAPTPAPTVAVAEQAEPTPTTQPTPTATPAPTAVAGADVLESLSAVFNEATATLSEPPKDNEDYYLLSTVEDLYWFAEQVNSGNKAINGKLTKDITVNKNVLVNGELNSNKVSSFRSWTPIGNADNRYSGTFDGGNYKVSGLYLDTNTDYVGLFGWVDGSGKIQNVGVVDSYLKGGDLVGSVCGVNYGTLQNCYNTGSVTGSNAVGGVCGNNSSGGTIQNCYNTGLVDAYQTVGGVCGLDGSTKASTLKNCYNIGSVTGEIHVGGVQGRVDQAGTTIQNCYFQETEDLKAFGIVNDSDTTIEKVESKTEAKFATGEVAWLLNKGNDHPDWRQNLTEPNKDPSPVLNGPEVYKIGENEYSNTNTSYTVTIPANATVGGEGVEVKASEVKLGDAQTLQVTIDSGLNENGALVMHKDTAEIAAAVKIGDEENEKQNPVVLTATNGKDATKHLTFTAPGTVPMAGTYTGTLVFEVKIVEQVG